MRGVVGSAFGKPIGRFDVYVNQELYVNRGSRFNMIVPACGKSFICPRTAGHIDMSPHCGTATSPAVHIEPPRFTYCLALLGEPHGLMIMKVNEG